MPAKKAATKATAKKATAKKVAKKATATKEGSEKAVAAAKKAAPVKTKAAGSKAPVVPSLEAIARQAYLNYLHRVQNGLPGDSHGDWIAAEKELTLG